MVEGKRRPRASPGSCPRHLRRPGRSNPPRLHRGKTETWTRAHPRAARRRPWRWAAGVSGLGSGPAALAKKRRPSSVRSRAATSGENPADWETADTTGLPSRFSTAERARSVTSDQSNRSPVRQEVWMLSPLAYPSERSSRSSLTPTMNSPPTDATKLRCMRGLIVMRSGAHLPRPSP
jgi:hypothetical protein